MIESVRLRHFKSHRDTTLPLTRITALVGPNSSGKTSVLQALHYISQLGATSYLGLFKGEREPGLITQRGQDGFSVHLQGHRGDAPWTFGLSIEQQDDTWSPKISWSWRGELREETPPRGDTTKPLLPAQMYHALHHAVYLKLNSQNLATPSYSTREVPRVEYDGWGLASTIAYLKTYEDEAFGHLQEAVHQVIPQVERIRIRKARVPTTRVRQITLDGTTIPFKDSEDIWGDELVFDMLGAKEVPAHATSEGTLLAVGLLTVLMSPGCPDLVLFDDVEQALHPKAQRELVQVLKKLVANNHRLQVIMTTHSPYIVDELHQEQVCVMATDSKGHVHARRLDEHPDAQRALEVLTTGEFLSAEGEDWVVGAGHDD